jgi:hypothetical protein
MSDDRPPNLVKLAACGARVAKAMRQPEPEEARAVAFFEEILLRKDGRELWTCLKEGLITETEIRDATIARFATWLCQVNGVKEPSSETWASPEIERCFEQALLGRPARYPRA